METEGEHFNTLPRTLRFRRSCREPGALVTVPPPSHLRRPPSVQKRVPRPELTPLMSVGLSRRSPAKPCLTPGVTRKGWTGSPGVEKEVRESFVVVLRPELPVPLEGRVENVHPTVAVGYVGPLHPPTVASPHQTSLLCLVAGSRKGGARQSVPVGGKYRSSTMVDGD